MERIEKNPAILGFAVPTPSALLPVKQSKTEPVTP